MARRRAATPEKAILFSKLGVALACSWPPPPTASGAEMLRHDALWGAAFVSSIALLLPLLAGIYEYRRDPVVLGKTVCLASAVAQVAIKMTVCRFQRERFQVLYHDMENFCRRATIGDRMVLQRYVDRYKYVHGVYILWSFLTAAFVISGPLYLPQTFPTHAVYPFPAERQPLKSILFLHQSLVGFQVSSSMAIDIQAALLLRYAAARFELLTAEFRDAKLDLEFNTCIERHDELLSFVQSAHRSVRYLVLTTVATTTVAVIFGSLNLITKQPLPVKAVYAIVVFSASLELFMYAWPADTLMRMCTRPAFAVYAADWFERDVKIQRKALGIITRCQKSEAIGISGILPHLSLPYYAKHLYTSLSYFTALRVIVESTTSVEPRASL